jgi:hypothetical protein
LPDALPPSGPDFRDDVELRRFARDVLTPTAQHAVAPPEPAVAIPRERPLVGRFPQILVS